ncbi:uncharacterized protein LOC142607494 isoform X1 [Castanea sativa]|uniref:uncharacterized protein LOC142607494 isoform X1 n=1 Tax=Castanea sativa TaxID=21020 RepID=UPI003F650F23
MSVSSPSKPAQRFILIAFLFIHLHQSNQGLKWKLSEVELSACFHLTTFLIILAKLVWSTLSDVCGRFEFRIEVNLNAMTHLRIWKPILKNARTLAKKFSMEVTQDLCLSVLPRIAA